MELNAEQIKKALGCCHPPLASDCNDCGYRGISVEGDVYIGCSNRLMADALALINQLTEENERLRGILLQFTDIVHKWGNKNGYDTSEISLVPILNEKSEIKKQIRSDTVRKMQETFKEEVRKYDVAICTEDAEWLIDQIAKEMLEGENEEG